MVYCRGMSFLKRFVAVCALFALVGQGCTKGSSPEAAALSERTTIHVWGVVDDIDAYQELFASFKQARPYVDLRFKRLRLEEYEAEILNALAEDTGPDVFLIHNTWTDKYATKILPAPRSVRLAVQTVSGGALGQKATYEVFETPVTSVRELRNDFADVVAQDFVRSIDVTPEGSRNIVMEDRVLAIPMSVDSLALYYNKDILNATGIPTAPETWEEFQAQVERIVRVGANDEIVRAGAGLGLGSNVERAADILSLLMMQNRTQMTEDNGAPTFTRVPPELSGQRQNPPGYEALRFYQEFANPTARTYTWDASQPNSLDAFVQGTSAFFLGYSYHLPSIRARAPKLNLGLAKAPQISGNPEVNFANYWGWTVSKKTKSPDLAWGLVQHLTDAKNVPTYLTQAERPAARKALLQDQLEEEDIGVFASQVLTARSWYRGKDPAGAERAFILLMDAAPLAKDENELRRLLRNAEEQVAQSRR